MARLTEAEKIERHRLEGAVLNTKHALKGAKAAFVTAAEGYAYTGKSAVRDEMDAKRLAMEEAWDAVGSAEFTLEKFDKAVEDRHAAAKAPKVSIPSEGGIAR